MSRSFFFFLVFKYSCGGERFTSRISVSERIFNSTLYAITSVIQLMTCFLKFQKYDFWNKRMIHTTTSDANTLSLSSWNTGEDKHWKVHLTSTLLNGRGRGLLHFAGASFPVGKQRSSKLSHQVNRKKENGRNKRGVVYHPPTLPPMRSGCSHPTTWISIKIDPTRDVHVYHLKNTSTDLEPHEPPTYKQSIKCISKNEIDYLYKWNIIFFQGARIWKITGRFTLINIKAKWPGSHIRNTWFLSTFSFPVGWFWLLF